jgi:lysozyme family protein
MPIETSPRFLACMPFVLQEEGGYSNDAHDTGGMTMHGIIQREYDAYRRRKGLPTQWVKNISIDEQNDIYFNEYWLPHCPSLPVGLDLSTFNINVNGGTTRGTHLLQRTLGLTDDGVWGSATESAVAAIKPESVLGLISKFAAIEEAWYRGLGAFKYFGRNWIGRSERCKAASIKMAQAAA